MCYQYSQNKSAMDYIQEEQSRLGYGTIIHSSLHHGAAMGLGIHDHWNSFEEKQYSLIDYINIDLEIDTTPPAPPSNLRVVG